MPQLKTSSLGYIYSYKQYNLSNSREIPGVFLLNLKLQLAVYLLLIGIMDESFQGLRSYYIDLESFKCIYSEHCLHENFFEA